MSEGSVSSTVAGGGGANKGHCSTAAKQRQLMEGRTSGSARKVQKSDERWPALWPSWDDSNEAPELTKANVGIAVEGSTYVAQGEAAIDLTSPGLSVIIDLSRKIFQQEKNYVVYRSACTLRLLFFLLATMCVGPETAISDKGDTNSFLDIRFPHRVCDQSTQVLLHASSRCSLWACDYVEAGKVLEKWNLPVVCSIDAGCCTCVSAHVTLTQKFECASVDVQIDIRCPHRVCDQSTRVLLHASSRCSPGKVLEKWNLPVGCSIDVVHVSLRT